MNVIQISPLGATAPSASSGKGHGPPAESAPHPKAKPQFASPDATADQQLAEARANFASAAEERRAKAEKARAEKAAKEAAEAKKRAEEAAVQLDIGTLEREVGTVDGTNKVFVDLVDPILRQSVARVFGPPADGGEPRPAAAGAANAYAPAAAPPPAKDLGVV